jgi:hypothetical protein
MSSSPSRPSRVRHVELRALDGSRLAVDLGSTNGTRLLGRARAVAGDELVLGDCPLVLDAG